MDILRGPGRIAALDVPGLNPFALALLVPAVHPYAADRGLPRVSRSTLLEQQGPRASGSSRTSTTTSQGINAWRTFSGNTGRPWTRNDVIAVAALIGAVFGKGGGDEARRSQLLSALQHRLGDREGEQVWNDLREQNDPEAPSRSTASSASGPAPQRQGQRRHRRRQPRHLAARELGRRAGVAAVGEQRAPGRARAARRPATRSSSRARRSATSTRRCSTRSTSTAAASTPAAPRSPAPARTSSSGAARTTRGARPPRATTSSTSSSRRSAATTRTTSSTGECREMTTSTPARSASGNGTPVVLQRDRARPGDRLRDRRRQAGRALAAAHDPRPRGRERARVRGPQHECGPRPRRASSTPRNKIEFTFNWFYADNQRHRDVLERPAARPPPAGRPRPADDRHRQLRVARLPVPGQAPARRRRRPTARSQLEQQAGARAGRPRTTSGATARSTATTC